MKDSELEDLHPISKSDLRKKYCDENGRAINKNTFRKYLLSVPSLKLTAGNQKFFPADLKLIFNHLGRP